jgi:hypothetical protein
VETWAGCRVATGGDTTAGWVVDAEPEEALEPDEPEPDDPDEPEDGDCPVAGVVAGVFGVAAFALCPGSALLK